jgi:hypothetical protein
MKKIILITVAALYLIVALRLSIVDACFWSNPETKDNGVGIILNEHVYDAVCKALCVIHLDDNGAIGDIKIPMTRQTYIVFEV